eukprot:jgi/Tetstr1/425107/TSEL_015569.t2
MECDDPAEAAMHLAYAATFDPAVYLRRQLACGRCNASTRRLLPQPPMMPPSRPPLGGAHRRAAKLTVVHELRRARQALDTADLGMVSDAAAALPVLEALHPPLAPTDPEYSPPEEPPVIRRAPPSWGGNADEVRRWGEDQTRVPRRAPRLSAGHVDWWRWEHIKDLDVPSWRMWVNRCLAGRGHSRTAAFLASGTVFALHKDDIAACEERAKTGEPLRVRPLGVGSVRVGALGLRPRCRAGGADAREAMAPVQRSFQS